MTEKSTFNICNFVKSENPLERLSSLSSSRDLSLGGTKPKKVFAPNFKLTRNIKSTPKEATTLPSTSKYNKRVPRFSIRRSKRNDNRFVQSTVNCGVFSEGTGVEIHKSKSSRFPYKDEPPHDNTAKKPFNARSHVTVKPNTKPIQFDSSVIIEDEDDTETKINDHLPVFIPLSSNKRSFAENFSGTADYNKADLKDRVPHFTTTNHLMYKTPLLSLVKLPQQCSVDKLIDSGEIGKILVRQSGNVDVLLGNLCYTLDAVDMCPFTETVISLPTKIESKTEQNIVDLGAVSESLVLCPNWDDLFDKKT